jgi:hypothetical protein
MQENAESNAGECRQGKITYQGVPEAFGLEYKTH